MYMEDVMIKNSEDTKKISLMSPKVDFVFKRIFGRGSCKNQEYLILRPPLRNKIAFKVASCKNSR